MHLGTRRTGTHGNSDEGRSVVRLCDSIASARGLIGTHRAWLCLKGAPATVKSKRKGNPHRYFVRTALAVGLRELSRRI